MATFKFILKTDRKDDHGHHPIYLRITHNRKKKYKRLELSLEEKYWNEEKQQVRKSHAQPKKLNLYLDRVLGKAKLAPTELNIVTAENIKAYLDGRNTDSFIEYAERIKESYNYHYRKNMIAMLSVLKEFQQEVLFSDITPTFLKDWQSWLLEDRSQNTASEYIRRLRTIMYRAMEDGVIKADENLFVSRGFKLSWEDTNPTPLTPQQFRKLRDSDLPEPLDLYRDLFLFSVYNDGMRLTDVLTFESDWIRNGRAFYQMSKTKRNKEIQLVPAAKELIEKHENGTKYVFPLLSDRYSGDERRARIDGLSSTVWKKLRDIANEIGFDKLHFHMARSTSGYLALQNGWSLVEIQEMLGHSNIQQTRKYLGKMSDDILTDKRDDLFD